MFIGRPDSRTQERMRAMVENPRRRAFWAARSRRRIAVVVLTATTLTAALFLALPLVVDAAWSPIPFISLVGFVVLMLSTMVIATQVNIATRWVVGYRGVDEFQRAEMDRATLLGHHVTAGLATLLIAVTAAFATAAPGSGMGAELPLAVLAPLVVITAMTHAAFPACFLAWTRPDEVPDDE
ncbi:hypothetical protein [Nocardiopsis lambiniae]|uniref:Uncharacterized protein n=1 Tax=Nocardiopsis lambiniae TaxID=3075539 RepID=A0ABU2M7R4_9ACTN|nr:hypothetical protein [Nocardiopsis sp. DSM 44743]MDT0328011.1 hypothetical protein [Nocardiopsis sp. DSM 44743]